MLSLLWLSSLLCGCRRCHLVLVVGVVVVHVCVVVVVVTIVEVLLLMQACLVAVETVNVAVGVVVCCYDCCRLFVGVGMCQVLLVLLLLSWLSSPPPLLRLSQRHDYFRR